MVQPSLRVARVDVSGYRLLTSDFAGLDALHRELRAVIVRHLPGVTASVLALPVPSADGKTVDWYSDLTGQPVPLAALPAQSRALVKAKLTDRLASIRRLADDLPKRVRGSEALAQALRSATQYPDDTHILAVGDEPVLTLWGFVLVEGGRGPGAMAAGSQPVRRSRTARRAWVLGAMVLLSSLLVAGWYWLGLQERRSLEAELGVALAKECTESHLLDALAARLDRIDPKGERYAALRETLAGEQARCTAAAGLTREFNEAGWDCARLAALRDGLDGADLTRQPLAGLASDLDARMGFCARGAELTARIQAQPGDCEVLAELDRALGTPPTQVRPLSEARERLTGALARCQAATEIDVAVTESLGNCEALGQLDRRLDALDAARPPLVEVKARLDAELALCAKAASYRQQLVDAQLDCTQLRSLEAPIKGEDASREPMASLRRRLDEALERCRTLEKLK